MGVSYRKLFKLLIDRKMKKKDLMEAAGISPSSMAKLGRDETVSLEVLIKICAALRSILATSWKSTWAGTKAILTWYSWKAESFTISTI